MKFQFTKKDSPVKEVTSRNSSLKDSHIEAGIKLRERRKELGISRRELSIRTLISPSVIEAIEKGWINKLPEKTYLKSMLIILEGQLGMPKGSLNGSLQKASEDRKVPLLRSFSPLSLEFLTSWQGSIIYLFALLISLFGINYQQRHLIKINSYTSSPIKISSSGSPIQINNENERVIEKILFDGYKFLPYAFKNFLSNKEAKELIIQSSELRSFNIKSKGGAETTIKSAKGIIRLKLSAPIRIKINPPLSSKDSIVWGGKKIKQDVERPGDYAFRN